MNPDWTIRGSKRFSNEAQILAEIEKCHVNSRRALEKAEAIDLQIRTLRENPPTDMLEDELLQTFRNLKMQAKQQRTYATNQVQKRAVKLGVKLSEFRTRAMPFLPDTSGSGKLR